MRRALAVGAAVLACAAAACSGPSGGSAPAPVTVDQLVYVAVGASETVGVGTEEALLQAWPQVFYREALPRGTVFTNLGVPGSTVGRALVTQVTEAVGLEPDLVTVWLNVNDLIARVPVRTYEQQLGELVRRLRRGGATGVLVANTPPLDRLPIVLACLPDRPPAGRLCPVERAERLPTLEQVNAEVAAYNDAIARVAAAEGAVVVDLHGAGLRAREQGTEAQLVAPDGFHPSPAGHAAVARAFEEAYRRSA